MLILCEFKNEKPMQRLDNQSSEIEGKFFTGLKFSELLQLSQVNKYFRKKTFARIHYLMPKYIRYRIIEIQKMIFNKKAEFIQEIKVFKDNAEYYKVRAKSFDQLSNRFTDHPESISISVMVDAVLKTELEFNDYRCLPPVYDSRNVDPKFCDYIPKINCTSGYENSKDMPICYLNMRCISECCYRAWCDPKYLTRFGVPLLLATAFSIFWPGGYALHYGFLAIFSPVCVIGAVAKGIHLRNIDKFEEKLYSLGISKLINRYGLFQQKLKEINCYQKSAMQSPTARRDDVKLSSDQKHSILKVFPR